MVEIHGECVEKFLPVKEAFAQNFEDGKDPEVGASFALTVDGVLVVDIWGGYCDAAKTIPWEKDSIVNVFSTTKVITALCIHILVERGIIDVNSPVAKYWPEFGQNGKEKVLVRHVLSHSSRVVDFRKKMPIPRLYDWKYVIGMLETQKPKWTPGTKCGYHAHNFGFILGELVRRVTGKTIGLFLKDEVTDPCNIDFHIGLPPEHDKRVAELIPYDYNIPRWQLGLLKLKAPYLKVLLNPNLFTLDWKAIGNDPGFRRAELPSSNGHGNARSIALLGAILANGSVNQHHFLSPQTIKNAITAQISGKDLVILAKATYGLGFDVGDTQFPLGPKTFRWGGFGGSACIMNAASKVSYGYAMNKMANDLALNSRRVRLHKAVMKVLDV